MNIGNGISAAGYAAGDLYAKKSLMESQSDLELQRAQRLAEFKANMDMKTADKMRTEQVARIDAKAGELADQSTTQKRGLIESGITDRSNWTAEQQSAVDQSLAMDRDRALSDPKVRTDAAIATGDIAPKDAAVLTQKDDAALYKMLWEKEREDRRDARESSREDRRDARFYEQQDRMDKRQERQMAGAFELLDKRLEAQAKKDSENGGKANTLQSTQVDGNGYLMGVYRNGTTKRLTDPDGKPVTAQSFEARVDRVANSLVKEGDSKYRKMDPEALRKQVRMTLMSGDGVMPGGEPPKPAAASPKPGASAATSSRPPLDSFLK